MFRFDWYKWIQNTNYTTKNAKNVFEKNEENEENERASIDGRGSRSFESRYHSSGWCRGCNLAGEWVVISIANDPLVQICYIYFEESKHFMFHHILASHRNSACWSLC